MARLRRTLQAEEQRLLQAAGQANELQRARYGRAESQVRQTDTAALGVEWLVGREPVQRRFCGAGGLAAAPLGHLRCVPLALWPAWLLPDRCVQHASMEEEEAYGPCHDGEAAERFHVPPMRVSAWLVVMRAGK